MKNIIYKIEIILLYMGGSVLVFLLCSRFFSYFFSGKTSFLILLATFLLLCMIYICYKSNIYRRKSFWIGLFIIGFLLKLITGVFLHDVIISDMKHCLTAAQMTLNGDLSWQDEQYFIQFAYQVPFVLYEAFILYLFKTIKALYFINVVLSILTTILLKKVVFNMLGDENTSWVISSLYMILPSTFLRVGVLYNQILGGFFLMCGLYFYTLKKKCILDTFCMIASSVFICFGCFFRQDVKIVLIAIVCIELFLLLKEIFKVNSSYYNFKRIVQIVLGIGCFIVGYYLMYHIFSNILVMLHLAKYGIANNAPYWSLITGMTPDSNGYYSSTYSYLVPITKDMPLLKAIKYIFNHISVKENMGFTDWILFFVKKIYYMWGSVEAPLLFNYSHSVFVLIAFGICCFETPIFIIMLGFAINGLKKEFQKNNTIMYLLIITCVIGFFIAYLFFEIQPRYRYNPDLLLFIAASFGIHKIMDL